MEVIGWIRQGDKAACGGIVVDGNPAFISHGRPYAFEGAHIACRKKCVIVEGYPLSTFNGRSQVLHGMITTSGCPLISTLNDIDGVGNDDGDDIPVKFVAGTNGEWLPVFSPKNHDNCEYDQHLVLEDQDGQRLDNIQYRLIDHRGAVIEGKTNAEGKTDIMAGDDGDAIDCEIALAVTNL